MKAVLCKSYGPPDALIVEDIAPAEAGEGEVVIRVHAVSLNFFDTLIIENRYQFKPDLPFSPGAEVAGVVSATGPGVTGIGIGDRVMAYFGWGGAREEVTARADALVRLPDGISDEAASTLAVTYGTTYHALKDRADIQPGETLAVLGAAGGTGQAAIELGKAMGARVIACASSEEKLAFCRSLGADETVNYADEDVKERLKALTDGSGVDVVYDPVGGDLSEQALRATGWRGRFLVVGFAAGEIPRIPLNLVLLKGCELVGVFWGAFVANEPDTHRANMETLVAWCAEGRIRPHIHRTYSLEETPEALEALARREVMGKVVIRP